MSTERPPEPSKRLVSHRGKPVVVIADGWSAEYPSIAAAAEAIGITIAYLQKKLKERYDDGVVVTTKQYGKVCVDFVEEDDLNAEI